MVKRILTREANRLIQFSKGQKFSALNTRRFSRVYIDREHKLLYNRISKNANSAITSYFYSLEFNEKISEDEVSREFAKSLLPHLDRQIVFDDLRDYRSLLVLREPKSRLLSAFLDKFREGSGYHKKYKSFDLTVDGFEAFLIWLKEGNLHRDRHWDLQINALAFPIDFFTDIIDTKDVNKKLPEFFNEVGLDGSLFLSHKNVALGNMHATNDKKQKHHFWNDNTNSLADTLLADDILIYNQYVKDR